MSYQRTKSQKEKNIMNQKVIMKYISESYITAAGRLKQAEADPSLFDEEQIESDRSFVSRVNMTLGMCCSETRMLIKGEYFEPSAHCWMYLYFRYSQLESMRKKALSEFFDKLDL